MVRQGVFQYGWVSCKLSSVVVTDDQAVKKTNLTITLDLPGKLNVGVLSVEMFVKMSISSLCRAVKVSST